MRTTINCKRDVLDYLKVTSSILDISTHDIIALLVHAVISDNVFKSKSFESVCYQERDPDNNWEKFHISFEPQVYEKCLDCRKFLKVSVSLFISFAIVNYLNVLVHKLKNSENELYKLDNYPFNYTIITKMFEQIQGFVIFWGIPKAGSLIELLLN